MAPLTIYKDNYADTTAVSNRFIDEYMKDANDAQLKVYFYLLRMLNANLATSVSDMADKFNHTEKDVVRALQYWEKKQILDLDYDDDRNVVGVHMRELGRRSARPGRRMHAPAPTAAFIRIPAPSVPRSLSLSAAPKATAVSVKSPDTVSEFPEFVKPAYSVDRLRQFKDDESAAQLLFIAESYLGRPLTPSDMRSILFFTDVLHFSDDLIDHLIQYCVERGKKDFKYIEKVAISWAEQGVTTPGQAQKVSSKYDKTVYAIMNALGKSGSPTAKEMEYITRWTTEYGFTADIIFEACERTVLATDRHRFEYAEGILSSWKKADVHHKSDILKMDELFQKRRCASRPSVNKFNQFTQNNYDFDALEKEILSN